MKEDFIQTNSYTKMNEAFQVLRQLPMSAPKMGLGYGSFGLGKTIALERIAAKEEAIFLRTNQTWTKMSVLKNLCFELGIEDRGKSSDLYIRIKESLLFEPKIIIVDEIDTLLRGSKYEVLELFRDIHDETGVIIFYVGMEEANAKLKRYRHYYSRIVEFVEFNATSKDDIQKFCQLSEVTIEDDLVQYFTNKCPDLRSIRVNIIAIEKLCKQNGLSSASYELFKVGVEDERKRKA